MKTDNIANIFVKLNSSEIDYAAVGAKHGDFKTVFDYLVSELSTLGGTATIEASPEGVTVNWVLPVVVELVDIVRALYISHLLQAGLMLNPIMVIADTAYNGGIVPLAMNLLSINSKKMNTYIAQRDAMYLALVAPMSIEAHTIYGMILLENGQIEKAIDAFARAQQINPGDYVSCKYLSLALITSAPKKSVLLAEKCLSILAYDNIVPDAHMRATYGMALLAAKMKKEASMQFLLICGCKTPLMTPAQWVAGGYQIRADQVKDVLTVKPKKK